MSVPTNLIGKRVGPNRIELTTLLGEGSYGAVYRGVYPRSGLRSPKQCAVKVQRNSLDQKHQLCMRRERELHERVSDGDGIVTLYESFKEGAYIFIVMKFCPDGDLWSGINRGRFLGNDYLIKEVFSQILDAVEYCHLKSVYHRDIKPENVLLSCGGHKAFLADFGLATGEPRSDEMRLGSPWYMSPECWGGLRNTLDESYSTAQNDIWSLGVLLINLACGRHAPWKFAHQGDSFFNDFTRQPNLLRLFVPLSPQVHDILARIFVHNPASRISIVDLRVAIRNVRCFVIPSSRRNEYHDYQRAVWKATVGPSPSRPLSIRIIPAFKPLPPAYEEDSNRDQTTLVGWDSHPPDYAFNQDVTIVGTSPQQPFVAARADSRSLPMLPRASSSTSSVDSDGPCTPDMPATVPDIEVADIVDLAQDAAQGSSTNVIVQETSPSPKGTNGQTSFSFQSWRGIMDAIEAA